MKLLQQMPNCSDFDVALDGAQPSFRVLLPEVIKADGLRFDRFLHTIPGTFEISDGGARGTVEASAELTFSVGIGCAERELAVTLDVLNTSPRALTNVRGNICVAVNHLPGEPPWCNRAFIPDAPLDRDEQGIFWYEQVTPDGLLALCDDGWTAMHTRPDDADAGAIEKYSLSPGPRDDVYGCAVRSHDGRSHLFQAWDVPCAFCSPFPGNACMHLLPSIAASIEPGGSASIRGLIGVFDGDRDALARRIRDFR